MGWRLVYERGWGWSLGCRVVYGMFVSGIGRTFFSLGDGVWVGVELGAVYHLCSISALVLSSLFVRWKTKRIV
jgi:hypothetical protein